MKFIRRRTASPVTVESLGIKTSKDMWNAIAQFTGYNMALIERDLRTQYAAVLLAEAKRMGIPPNPAWRNAINNPDFFDDWRERIESGEYADEQIDEIGKGNEENLNNLGIVS